MDHDPTRLLARSDWPLTLQEHAEFVCDFRHLNNVSIRQTRADFTNMCAVGVCIGRMKRFPVSNSIGIEVDIFFDVGNTVKVVGIQLVSRNEQTARFLKDSPSRHGVKGAIVLATMQVQAQAGTEAHCAYYGPIRGTILYKMSIKIAKRIYHLLCTQLVRHDANAGWIFVNEDMIWLLMWTVAEYMTSF